MKAIKPPLIVINFKAYPASVGSQAVQLAQNMEKVAQEYSITMIPAVQHADIYRVSNEVNLPVFAQSLDLIESGAKTGWVTLQSIKEAGAQGSLINHSEHPLTLTAIETLTEGLKKENLLQLICAPSAKTSAAIAHFEPWAIAMEPPELIGGDISVTTRPDVIKETIAEIKAVNKNSLILTGAGVKTGEHLLTALELGTQGVLLASGVTKAKDPYKVLVELAQYALKSLET